MKGKKLLLCPEFDKCGVTIVECDHVEPHTSRKYCRAKNVACDFLSGERVHKCRHVEDLKIKYELMKKDIVRCPKFSKCKDPIGCIHFEPHIKNNDCLNKCNQEKVGECIVIKNK